MTETELNPKASISETWAKTQIAAVYDDAAATYNCVGPSFFSYFAERLVAGAEIQAGLRILHVATGRTARSRIETSGSGCSVWFGTQGET